MNWTPCGCLPLFFRLTSTRPPLVVFGAVKLALFPCSLICSDRFVGFVLLPPHPAMAAAPPISAIPANKDLFICPPLGFGNRRRLQMRMDREQPRNRVP